MQFQQPVPHCRATEFHKILSESSASRSFFFSQKGPRCHPFVDSKCFSSSNETQSHCQHRIFPHHSVSRIAAASFHFTSRSRSLLSLDFGRCVRECVAVHAASAGRIYQPNHGIISTCPRNSSHTNPETTKRGFAFVATCPFPTASSHVTKQATKWRQLSGQAGTVSMYAHIAAESFIRRR